MFRTPPHVTMRPDLEQVDGFWIARYGMLSATGETPAEAMEQFDKFWMHGKKAAKDFLADLERSVSSANRMMAEPFNYAPEVLARATTLPPASERKDFYTMLQEVPLPCNVRLRAGINATVTKLNPTDKSAYPIVGHGPLLNRLPVDAKMSWTRHGFGSSAVMGDYDIVDIIIVADDNGKLIPIEGQEVELTDVTEDVKLERDFWGFTPGEVHARLNAMENGPWKGIAPGLTGKQDFEEAKKRFEFDLRNFINVGDKCVTRAGHLAVYKGHSGNKEDPLQFFDETSGTRFKVTKEGRYNISPDNPKENGFDIMHPDWAD